MSPSWKRSSFIINSHQSKPARGRLTVRRGRALLFRVLSAFIAPLPLLPLGGCSSSAAALPRKRATRASAHPPLFYLEARVHVQSSAGNTRSPGSARALHLSCRVASRQFGSEEEDERTRRRPRTRTHQRTHARLSMHRRTQTRRRVRTRNGESEQISEVQSVRKFDSGSDSDRLQNNPPGLPGGKGQQQNQTGGSN